MQLVKNVDIAWKEVEGQKAQLDPRLSLMGHWVEPFSQLAGQRRGQLVDIVGYHQGCWIMLGICRLLPGSLTNKST